VRLVLPTNTDSRVILDQAGAEELPPPGEALYRQGGSVTKVRVPYLSVAERNRILKQVLTPALDDEEVLSRLTEKQQAIFLAARRLQLEGLKPTVKAIRKAVGGNTDFSAATLHELQPYLTRKTS
jgi:DNA segregation ATPase FtsK/SpoIIIE-like protein